MAVMLFHKALIRGGAAHDLFATPVQVKAHVRHGQLIAPYTAMRKKAPEPRQTLLLLQPPEPKPPLIIVKHDVVEAHPAPPVLVSLQPKAELASEAKRKAQATKLREAADKVIAAADADMNRDRQSNTARRARMAASSIGAAQAAGQIGATMRNLADAIEAGEARHLAKVSTRAAVEMLDSALRQAMYQAQRAAKLSYSQQQRQEGRPATTDDIVHARIPGLFIHRSNVSDLVHELNRNEAFRPANAPLVAALQAIHAKSGDDDMLLPVPEDLATKIITSFNKSGQTHAGWQMRDSLTAIGRYRSLGINNDADLRAALGEYLELRGGRKAENPITKLERALVGGKHGIDFFPTPAPLVSRMVALAGVQAGQRVLEPSAGKGDIADQLKAAGAKVDALEISDTLRAIIEAKGHHLVGRDFNEYAPGQVYDRIVMNPPWSGNADIAHVRRAYDMLKPGGRLVALISPHSTFASDKPSVAFRAWMDELGGTSEKHTVDEFKSQWMPQGIASVLITVDKPER